MRDWRRLIQLIASLGVLCLAPIVADSTTADATAAARASLERIQTLRKERPNDGILAFYEALVDLTLGEHAAALDLLRSLEGRKLGLIPVRDIGFETVWEDPEFQAIRKKLADEEPQTPTSPLAFRLTDPKLIPEGMAYDPKSERFFIGSIAQRKIVITDAKGQARDFSSSSDKLDPVLGLRVDVARRQLYAVSTNGFEENAKTERRNAVVQYDLKSGRLTNRYLAPEASQLNDLVVASDGTLYVTDSMGDTLFRRRPGEKTLSRFGEAGAVRGVNGIALGNDGSLYVAVSTGIARIDTATGKATRLPQPDTVVTGGCDGLYWSDGDLIGVQNSTNPGRVIRIALTDKGNRIAGLTVLQSHHHPDFTEPTTGAIANEAFNVIGNSYVGYYQPDGVIRDSTVL
jgi:hypothetical protein